MMSESTILLVEDNPDDEELTVRALRKEGVGNDIVVAHDGAAALEWLFGENGNGGHRTPHLILLDLKLPKVDGFEVLHAIRQQDSTRLLPVVVLTSSEEERDIVESYSSGANSYVRKPVDFMQFREAVRELGLYWLLLNRVPTEGRA
jgi:CheY-like chemotaxis protein